MRRSCLEEQGWDHTQSISDERTLLMHLRSGARRMLGWFAIGPPDCSVLVCLWLPPIIALFSDRCILE